MEMQGSRSVAVTRQQAWDGLNDPEVLKACIPGCDRIEITADNQFAVGVAVKIGPVAARFSGKVVLTEIEPPVGYTLNFDGQGGAAGFGKGQSQVRLEPGSDGRGCQIAYTVKAQVGGKIAQLGQRLIDGVARSMADDFFKRFEQEMKRRHPEAGESAGKGAPVEAATDPGTSSSHLAGIPGWAWAGAAGLALVIAYVLAR